jgi:hypothetical protein
MSFDGLEPQNWEACAGDSVRLPIPVTDRDGQVTNLAGAIARFALARTEDAAPVVSSYGVGEAAVATISSPSTGQVLITIASAATRALIGSYVWFCEVEDVFGNEVVVAFGRATFRPNLIN